MNINEKSIAVNLISDKNYTISKDFKIPIIPNRGDIIHFIDKDGGISFLSVDHVVYHLRYNDNEYTIDIVVKELE